MKTRMLLPDKYPVYFERRKWLIVVLLMLAFISGAITYYSFKAYTVYHIYSAFVFAVSLVYLSWIYFNPYCIIHQDYFEINSGLFSHKKFVYRDVLKVEVHENEHTIFLIYNDYDSIPISLKAVPKKDRSNLIELIKLHVYKDVIDRE